MAKLSKSQRQNEAFRLDSYPHPLADAYECAAAAGALS